MIARISRKFVDSRSAAKSPDRRSGIDRSPAQFAQSDQSVIDYFLSNTRKLPLGYVR